MKKSLLLILYFSPITLFAQWTYTNPADVSNSNIHRVNGNIGIGTSTPTNKLEISGTTVDMMKVTSTTHAVLAVESTGTAVNPYLRLLKSGVLKWSFYNDYYSDGLFFQAGDGSTKMTISQNGNVGLGTTSPSVWFGSKTFEFSDARPVFKLSSTSPTGLSTMIFTNNFVNGSTHLGEFHVNHHFNQADAAKSTLRIGTYPGGDILVLQSDGNVGVGTTDPKGYRLAVAGKAIAEEIVVKTIGNWPDYVFEKNYNLPTLTELEAYINVNKHLPEVPSACAVEENGINLGEMNMLLLKKVEELTLYVIEQNKMIVEEREIIKKQNERITKLELAK